MASLSFNATEVDPYVAFESLPEGEYLAVVDDSDVKQTRAGNGSYIELVFQVVDGPYKGRKVWDRLTYTNNSEKAVQIGRAKLSSLCRAVGVANMNDTSELHGRPVLIAVSHEKTDQGKLFNRVDSYKAQAGNAPGVVQGGSSKPAIAAAPVTPPWKK